MRRFCGLGIMVAFVALQFGVGHASVCRSLMPTQEKAPNHCAKPAASPHAKSGCTGMAGCAELCRGGAAKLPTAPGKEAPQVPVQPESAVTQAPAQGAVQWGVWIPSESLARIAESSKTQPPQAFILFHTLLI